MSNLLKVELNIKGRTLSEEDLDMIRLELRRNTLQFVFDAVNTVARTSGKSFSHRDVSVTGDITLQQE